jgi:hypothetical protein
LALVYDATEYKAGDCRVKMAIWETEMLDIHLAKPDGSLQSERPSSGELQHLGALVNYRQANGGTVQGKTGTCTYADLEDPAICP